MLDFNILSGMPDRNRRLGIGTVTILQAMDAGKAFGFEIMDATGLTSGTVYPALDRLEDLGYARSRWEADHIAHRDARPARRYFEITAAGRRVLAEALERYPVLRAAVRPQER
jgi:PadR family transcriptional regulator PadR